MASRQEEKAQRRREREEAERAHKAAEARRKRLGIVLGGVLAVAVAAIVVVAIMSSGGSDEGPRATSANAAAPPPQRIEDLAEAAEAAKCKVAEQPDRGSGHTGAPKTFADNPPTSGPHDPEAAREGIYPPGSPPDVGQSIHALEHGRVNIQYKPGTDARKVGQLEGLFNEELQGYAGFKTLLFENQTSMRPAVAATAWTQSLTCPQWNDQVFDAIRAFRRDFVGKGPEAHPSEFEQ